MRQLVIGFRADASDSSRWREMAWKKQAEIDQQIVGLEVIRRVLQRVMRSNCLGWSACGLLAASGMGMTAAGVPLA